MASKYYAVKKGKVPGIYFNWNDCKAMVDGYQGAVYQAECFLSVQTVWHAFYNGWKTIHVTSEGSLQPGKACRD